MCPLASSTGPMHRSIARVQSYITAGDTVGEVKCCANELAITHDSIDASGLSPAWHCSLVIASSLIDEMFYEGGSFSLSCGTCAIGPTSASRMPTRTHFYHVGSRAYVPAWQKLLASPFHPDSHVAGPFQAPTPNSTAQKYISTSLVCRLPKDHPKPAASVSSDSTVVGLLRTYWKLGAAPGAVGLAMALSACAHG